MKFKYKAKTKNGDLQAGFVESATKDSALNVLLNHELFVLSLEEAGGKRWYDDVASFFGRVRRKDLIVFTRQMATLLEARLPLTDALKTLHEQTQNPRLKEAVQGLIDDIDSGLSLSQAMERQGDIFPSFFIEMIRAAEVTGNLNEVAGFLADYAEKEGVLVQKAASAMIYPAVVVSVFVAVVFIILTMVFPQIGPIFEQSGVQLPIYTRILIGTGTFASKWWPAILLFLIVIGFFAFDYSRTEEGRAIVDDAKVKLPIVNKIYLPVTIARFANASALLIHGGIPVAQTLEIVSHMLGNVLYRDLIHEVSESVRRGEPISAALVNYPEYFPPLVSQMLAVGEKTGQIEQIMNRLATFYTREADNIINNLVDLIQPALMILIGVMVGFLFASVLIPLYQLTTSIH